MSLGYWVPPANPAMKARLVSSIRGGPHGCTELAMTVSLRSTSKKALADFQISPTFLFAGGLEDRCFGQCLRLLGGCGGFIKIAAVGEFLRRGQRRRRRGPLVAQGGRLLVGGFGGGVGRLVVVL